MYRWFKKKHDLPMTHGDFPGRSVEVPEGNR